jgi:hypothetical protein
MARSIIRLGSFATSCKTANLERSPKTIAPLSSRTRGAFVVPPAFTPTAPSELRRGSLARANGRTRFSYGQKMLRFFDLAVLAIAKTATRYTKLIF